MAELLKHRYSKAYIEGLARAVAAAEPRFDAGAFTRAVLGNGWKDLELKQRMQRIAATLHAFVPGDYRAQLAVLLRVAPQFGGFEAMLFPDFVEQHGLADFDASVAALEAFTQYSSSEFAVRPFLVRYGDRMLGESLRWARHPNAHVRRLASEGVRPRLPWAMALPAFKRDPRPLLPILELLKDDPSEDVRRSVANCLNDIAKDHPAVVLDVAARWLGQSDATDRLVRHACRTLLKRGDQKALALFGHHDAVAVKVSGLSLAAATVTIGADLGFTFKVRAAQDAAVRIEYAVDFVKADGRARRKVFQLGVKRLAAGVPLAVARTHRLRDFSTRKHYPGRHAVAVLVNGVERAKKTFMLVATKKRKRGGRDSSSPRSSE